MGRLQRVVGIGIVVLAGQVGSAQAAIPAGQRTYLEAFYTMTGGGAWTTQTDWNGAAGTECVWYGVACNNPGLNSVVFISLPGNNLIGTLPPNLATELPDLHTLLLISNHLSGNLPDLAPLGSDLQVVNLSFNDFTGLVPSLTGLTGLVAADFGSNDLSGPLPSLAGLTSLQQFSVQGNQITGSIPDLTDLTSATVLRFEENLLTGPIPSLATLTNLSAFYVKNNDLDGPVPSLAGLPNLTYFVASGNQLSGGIPALAGLTNLTGLFLDNNQLTGTIPSLAGLGTLNALNLSRNQLTGTIPDVSSLTSVTQIQVQSNRLVGPLPASLASLSLVGPSGFDLRWNGLYTSDPVLAAFVAAHQNGGDWESTQTIAVTGLSASAPTATTVDLSFTPIAYTADAGFYEALYSTTPGGPYTLFGTPTANKASNSLTVTGLAADTSYCFVVRTTTLPHAQNANTVVSEPSAEVCSMTTPVELLEFSVD